MKVEDAPAPTRKCARCGHRRSFHKGTGCTVEWFVPHHGGTGRQTLSKRFCLCRGYKPSQELSA